jgi:putative nucleotide binding protein
MTQKEENAIVLDYLPYGYPLENKMMPIAQAIGENHWTLLQIVPRRGMNLELGEKVYIGEGKRDKVYYILGRVPENKLTETAKQQLSEFVRKQIEADEKKFVDFFNNADPINTRLHQLELLPGFGKKHTCGNNRGKKKKPFETIDELKKRVSNLPDPKKAIEKRIIEEITEKQRYSLFVTNN